MYMYAAAMTLLQLSAHMKTPPFGSRTGTGRSRQSARGFLQMSLCDPHKPSSAFSRFFPPDM